MSILGLLFIRRPVDGFLLERQKGSGTLSQLYSWFDFSYPFQKLFARRGKLEDVNQSPWTSFEMVLREPTPIPPAFDLTRFLASSITFMTYLQEVSVYFNDWCLVKLNKAVGYAQVHQLPRDFEGRSPNNYMTVTGLKMTRKFNGMIIHYLEH